MKITIEISDLIELVFGPPGATLNATKSDPKILYNANLIVGDTKVWYGDFNFISKKYKLQDLARTINMKVYLLCEMDARFDNEENPLLNKAVLAFDEYGIPIQPSTRPI